MYKTVALWHSTLCCRAYNLHFWYAILIIIVCLSRDANRNVHSECYSIKHYIYIKPALVMIRTSMMAFDNLLWDWKFSYIWMKSALNKKNCCPNCMWTMKFWAQTPVGIIAVWNFDNEKKKLKQNEIVPSSLPK